MIDIESFCLVWFRHYIIRESATPDQDCINLKVEP